MNDYTNIKGLIFSGGPSTVTRNKFQSVPKDVLKDTNIRHMLWFTINCKTFWR